MPRACPYAAYLLFLISTFYYFDRAVRSNAGLKPWVPLLFQRTRGVFSPLRGTGGGILVVVPLVVARSQSRSGLRALLVPAIGGFALWTFFLVSLYAVPLLNGKVKDLPVGHPPPDFTSAFWENSTELLTGSRYAVVAWLLVLASVVGLVHAFRTNRIFTGALLAAAAGQLAASVHRAAQTGLSAAGHSFRLLQSGLQVSVLQRAGVRSRHAAGCTSPRGVRRAVQRRPVVDRCMAVRPELCARYFSVCSTPILRRLSMQAEQSSAAFGVSGKRQILDPFPNVRRFLLHAKRTQRTGIPDFYAPFEQRRKPCRLVEYPLELGDDENPFYLYQYHHGCEVLAGYSASSAVGAALRARDQLRFNQLTAVDDFSRLRATGADGVVVHLDLMNEVQGKKPGRSSRETTRVLGLLENEFGPPTYVDRWLRVFSLHP